MKTSQLVVLWYGVMLVIAWLIHKTTIDNETPFIILVIALFTGLLIYTLNPHPNANKRKALLCVLLPVPLTIGLIYGTVWVFENIKQNKETACVFALSKIEIEEKNAELDKEGLGRELKRTMQTIRKPIYNLSPDERRIADNFVGYFENTLVQNIPEFNKCSKTQKEKVRKHWVEKFVKGAN